MLTAYPNRGLHGRVVHDIGFRIVSGVLAPGTTLASEAELCAELGVSRSVLREAIKVLVGKGLLLIRPRTGTQVCPRRSWHLMDPDVLGWIYEAPTPRALDDLAVLRFLIEPGAARLAAERATDADVQRIMRALDDMAGAAEEPSTFIAADLAFHNAVFEASGNELLGQLNQSISIAFGHTRPLHSSDPKRYEDTMARHARVAQKIQSRDADGAEVEMRVLVEMARVDMREYVRHHMTTGSSRRRSGSSRSSQTRS